MKRLASLLFAIAVALPAWAHQGENHGTLAEPTSSGASLAPRASATTESFSLLAVGTSAGLSLYLDDVATNAPVAGARIEVQDDTAQAEAAQIERGVYRIDSERLASPGRHSLTITVLTDDAADLMTLVIDIPGPAATTPRSTEASVWRPAAVWGASGAFLLAGAGFIAVRRRVGRPRSEDPSR